MMGLLFLTMKKLQIFNILKDLFLPEYTSIKKPTNPIKLAIEKYKYHPCVTSLKKSTSVDLIFLRFFFSNRNYRRS